MPAPARKPAMRMPPPPERRYPVTIWLTPTERSRVNRLRLVKDDPAMGRKALMLGVSIIENGLNGQASIAGMRA